MDTTNKLKTEVQMKKMRPTRWFCSGVAVERQREQQDVGASDMKSQ
jgi:hypothetical protein